MKKKLHFGLLGESLPHTLSPEIHEYLFARQKIDASYEKIELPKDEVRQIFNYMKSKDLLGINVTIPHKELVCEMVDVPDEHAKKIGAVNTILIKDGVSYGYNTDYIGVLSMFHKANVSLANKKIVILGSGGSAKALVYAFYLAGAQTIIVAARNITACAQLKQQFPYLETCSLNDILQGDIIINTTPMGMYPNTEKSPVDISVIQNFSIACDIVYNPLMTTFLQLAKEANLQVVTGLMMLVDQAIAAQEIWFDKSLDYTLGNDIHDKLARQLRYEP